MYASRFVRWLPGLFVLLLGCDPKPLAVLPALSGEKPPDSTERAHPDGSTLEVALALLEPRMEDVRELERRRSEFEQTLAVLVPDPRLREQMGFRRVVRWHLLYTRRLQEHHRRLAAHKEQLRTLLHPPTGASLHVNDSGVSQVCRPAADANAPHDQVCAATVGAPQLTHEVTELGHSVNDLLEAHGFLITHLANLRKALREAPEQAVDSALR